MTDEIWITYLWTSKKFPPVVRLEGRRGEYEVYTPERTCKVIDFHEHIMMDDPDWFELSCGHVYETTTRDREPPNYCPNCGAKVIRR